MKDEHDNKTADWVEPEFKLGDLVVYKDFHIDFLLKIDLLIDGGVKTKSDHLYRATIVRTATTRDILTIPIPTTTTTD